MSLIWDNLVMDLFMALKFKAEFTYHPEYVELVYCSMIHEPHCDFQTWCIYFSIVHEQDHFGLMEKPWLP